MKTGKGQTLRWVGGAGNGLLTGWQAVELGTWFVGLCRAPMSSSLLLALLLPCLIKLGRSGLDLAEPLCSTAALLLVCLSALLEGVSRLVSA